MQRRRETRRKADFAQQLRRRTSAVLISENDLVEVGRDGQLVVSEIPQPGPLAAHGLGQERKNLPDPHAHCVFWRGSFGGRGALWSVIDTQAASSHSSLPYFSSCRGCAPQAQKLVCPPTLCYVPLLSARSIVRVEPFVRKLSAGLLATAVLIFQIGRAH